MNVSKKSGWKKTSVSLCLDTKTVHAPTSYQGKTVIVYEDKDC